MPGHNVNRGARGQFTPLPSPPVVFSDFSDPSLSPPTSKSLPPHSLSIVNGASGQQKEDRFVVVCQVTSKLGTVGK